ncbi:MAG: hypothetical protein WCB99_14450 [Candidatus Cybelea sp.]
MLSRQQIRERKRHLEKEEHQKRSRQQSLQELNDAERLLEQKRSTRDQVALQTGSLCVAILSQIPEHRTGIDGIADKAIRLLDDMLTLRHIQLTADEPEDEGDDEDTEDEDEEAFAEAS